ncbi:MAG: alkaline phosphatase family protein, partial [Myxococcota bacterium]|nr:alkaline phosphatase family protein [Myxococcota bacterium]
VRPVAPPAVHPVHTTLVTGVPPREHGVVADRLLGERGVRVARYGHASHVRAATLWEAVRAQGGRVAAFDWPATTGGAIPHLLPDVTPVRPGERWQALAAAGATPWIAELLTHAPEAAGRPGAARDGLLVQAACTVLRGPEPPSLVLLRLSRTEPVLEAEGPWTPAAREAFGAADADLAALVGCLAEAGRAGEAALLVAGDRAFRPVTGAARPNRVLRDAELLASAGPGRGLAWRALARSNGGSAFVYARDADAALAAREALEEAARATGAFRVVSAEEMIARRADPEAWFGLDAEPGFVLLDDSRGPVVGPAPVRAAGGRLRDLGPDPGSVGPGVVAVGRGLRGGLRAPRLAQEDVAPTLAALLGVELPDAEGRARWGWRAPAAARGGP